MKEINLKGINIKLAIDNYNIKARKYRLMKDSRNWLCITGFIGFILDPILLSNNIDLLNSQNSSAISGINRILIYVLAGMIGMLKARLNYDVIGLKSINKLKKVKKVLQQEGLNVSIEDLLNSYCFTYKSITTNAKGNKAKAENAINVSSSNTESCIIQEIDLNYNNRVNKTYLIEYNNK